MPGSVFQTLDPTFQHNANSVPDADADPAATLVPNPDADPVSPLADPVPPADADFDAAADFDVFMVWQGKDDSENDADPTALQAAIAYDTDSSSAHSGSPTSLDVADFYLADSTSSSPPKNPCPTAFATAADAADVFLSSSGTYSASSGGESDREASSPGNPISTAFPTASDAADVFFSLSETDSTEFHGEFKSESDADADADGDTDSDDNFSGSPLHLQDRAPHSFPYHTAHL